MSKIIVLAEHMNGSVVKMSLSAIGAAKQLAAQVGGDFDIAVVGHGVGGAAAQLTGYGAAQVFQVEDPAFEGYTAQS